MIFSKNSLHSPDRAAVGAMLDGLLPTQMPDVSPLENLEFSTR